MTTTTPSMIENFEVGNPPRVLGFCSDGSGYVELTPGTLRHWGLTYVEKDASVYENGRPMEVAASFTAGFYPEDPDGHKSVSFTILKVEGVSLTKTIRDFVEMFDDKAYGDDPALRVETTMGPFRTRVSKYFKEDENA